MNKTLTIALLFISNALFAQSKNPAKTNEILKTVELMNADAAYTTKNVNADQLLNVKAGESGQLIGYFKGSQLVKINARIALPSCIRTDKFYLQGDSLIMFYRQERDFLYDESSKTYNPSHATTAMECWYYYDGGQLLKSDTKGEAKCSGKPSDQQAMEMISTCKAYGKLLKK